jgi:histidinol dehydrogenase
MQIFKNPTEQEVAEIIKRPVQDFSEIEAKVKPVLEAVKNEGDFALKRFALDFDNILIDDFRVSEEALTAAAQELDEELKAAIDLAYANIYTFHKSQMHTEEPVQSMPGVTCWRKSIGIEKVGIYIPGGTAPLFSTVLMLAIPAQIAGCKEIILCSPSNHPAIYYCALKCGVTSVFRVGGAQAIAAMAYGTETVPKVYKIFGPGNQYVTAAKQLVTQSGVAIDMPAGPSEVAVLADNTANSAFVASDLLSQAEHGKDSQVLLVSTSEKLIQDTLSEVKAQLELLSRKGMADGALENSRAVLVKDTAQAMDLLNKYAPEHLILAVDNPEEVGERVINAGSVFLGHYTPESCGDYASGTNHTLPTNGYAKAYSGVSVDSFVKKITYQKITQEGLLQLGDAVMKMAEAEQLDAHKNAVAVRLK